MRERARQGNGKTETELRISLAGRVEIAAGPVVIDEQRFPGRQGRLVFAYLVAEAGRPVPREELATAIWGEHPPATWEKALSGVVSKLRDLLDECGVDGGAAFTSAFGCYRLDLPTGTVVDVEAAGLAIAAAEAALSSDDLVEAKTQAERAVSLTRPRFLPREEARWVDEKRREQEDLLVRGLACLGESSRRDGAASDAVRLAEEEVSLEPYRESGYRRLMQAHIAAGNRAEALRAYERCRQFLRGELGTNPSPETQAVHREALAVVDEPPHGATVVPPAAPERERPEGRRSRGSRVGLAGVLALAVAAAIVVVVLLRSSSNHVAQAERLTAPSCSPVNFAGPGHPELLVAADLPLVRGAFATTAPMLDAVDLLLQRHRFRAGRFSVGLQACNAGSATNPFFDEGRCRGNALAYSKDASVVGVVGPFASLCARIAVPILNQAADGPVALVSATNTSVGLTRRKPRVTLTGEPSVYYPTGVRNYARVIAADDVQAIGAAILARKLGVKRVFVLDNTNEDYGVPIANEFSRAATKLGIAVVGRSSWNPNAEHYFATARQIAAKRSNGVFFGGDSGGNSVGLLSDIRATVGARPVFIAPDGFDAASVLVAGHAAEGLYLCKPGVPTNRLGQAGREFVQAFAKRYGMKPSLFAVHSAQALAVLLDAISRSDGTRASVTKALFSTRISNGILGSFWITPSGDTTLNVVAVDRIVDGRVQRAAAINVPDDLISLN